MNKNNINNKKIRVYFVDDHPIIRQGLTILINNQEDMEVCGQASEAKKAISTIKKIKPDIAIIDISLNGMDGIELTKNIVNMQKGIKVIILSMHDESIYAERALRAGADGYIMKQEATDKIIESIRKVNRGDVCISKKVSSKILKSVIRGNKEIVTSEVSCLSDRELEVLRYIGNGLSNKQIADNLKLSIKTIETYRQRIKKKLALNKNNELIHFAFRWVIDEGKSEIEV